jgi:hypothetical protein
MPEYSIYGLTVSSDRALFALRPAPPERSPDIAVHFDAKPTWLPDALDGATVRYRTPDGQHPLDNLIVYALPDGFVFRYSDGTEFCVTPDGATVWCRWPEPATLADTETYLLGPVLGFCLRLRGVLCLHASAVVIDGSAVALAGRSLAGKSTTAAAFAAAGFAVIADDLVAVREVAGVPMAFPAYPYLKLWEDSETMLFAGVTRLPRLTPTWDKRALELDAFGYEFSETPLPLGAIVTLAPRAFDNDCPRVTPATPTDALLSIAPETYAGYLLDAPMRRAEFLALGALVARVRAFNAEPSEDPGRLPLLVQRIVDAVRR